MAAECGVAAVVIVGVQPNGKFVAAFGVAGVETGVGPFVGQGAVKSLHFSVGLRPVRSRSAVLVAAFRKLAAVHLTPQRGTSVSSDRNRPDRSRLNKLVGADGIEPPTAGV